MRRRPFPMKLFRGLGSWVKHLACWASVRFGVPAVCPGTHFPQLLEGIVCLKECLFMVCCEQSPI